MKLKTFLFILFLFLLVSCRQNNYRVNTNDIDLDLSIVRMENIMFGVEPSSLMEDIDSLKNVYPDFFAYLGYVINIGHPDDPSWNDLLMSFITSRQNVEVFSDAADKYSEIGAVEAELLGAWKHYSYYFPGEPVPRLFTCITGFNNSLIVGDSLIGISLDRYLGYDYKYYSMLGIYNYQQLWMIPEAITGDCMYGWASSTWELPEDEVSSPDVLSNIIHQGKLLYFTRCMLPDYSDSLLYKFTGPQLNFVVNNEQQIWEYLVEHDMLFSTDPLLIKKLTADAPFTSYFTRESPGRAANWIGFRIVESYMKNNQDISLAELMDENNLRSILEGAKYSPH